MKPLIKVITLALAVLTMGAMSASAQNPTPSISMLVGSWSCAAPSIEQANRSTLTFLRTPLGVNAEDVVTPNAGPVEPVTMNASGTDIVTAPQALPPFGIEQGDRAGDYVLTDGAGDRGAHGSFVGNTLTLGSPKTGGVELTLDGSNLFLKLGSAISANCTRV